MLLTWRKRLNGAFDQNFLIITCFLMLFFFFIFFPLEKAIFLFCFFFSVVLFLFNRFFFLIFLATFFTLYSGLGIFWEIDFLNLHFNFDGLAKLFYVFLFVCWFLIIGYKQIKIRNTFLGLPLMVLAFLSLIRLFPSFSQSGLSVSLNLFFYLGLYLLTLAELRSRNSRIFKKAIFIAVLANLIFFFGQILKFGWGDISVLKEQAKGFLGHAGGLAVFLAIVFPLYFQEKTFLMKTGTFFILGAIFATFIRSIWFSIASFLTLSAIFWRNKMALFLVLSFSVLILLLPQARNYLFVDFDSSQPSFAIGSYKIRVQMWNELIANIKAESWFWGKGSGFSDQYIKEKPNYGKTDYFTAHNMWVEVLVDWGILGISLLIFLVFRILKFIKMSENGKNIGLNCLLTLVIVGFFLSLLNLTTAFIYWFLVLALAEAEEFRTHFLLKKI